MIQLVLLLLTIGAWLTHIVTCIQASAWLLMIAGALIFPVAILHGISTWLGTPWVH